MQALTWCSTLKIGNRESDGRTWKDAHLDKKKKMMTIKITQDVCENPREGIKNHGLSKNVTFLLGLARIMYQKENSLQ